jgi:hypothetical protein
MVQMKFKSLKKKLVKSMGKLPLKDIKKGRCLGKEDSLNVMKLLI